MSPKPPTNVRDVDLDKPNAARMYDYYLGGSHNFESDRELAAQVEQDRARWRRRADQARARQRLEGSHYGWLSDNFPPRCLEAARAANRREAEDLLPHPPAAPA